MKVLGFHIGSTCHAHVKALRKCMRETNVTNLPLKLRIVLAFVIGSLRELQDKGDTVKNMWNSQLEQID